jgi:ADP-heptose:LPS heptosyltransferase
VSDCAYAIRKGAELVDFPDLISRSSLRSSVISASYRAPTRLARRTIARVAHALLSPRSTRIWSKAFVRGRGGKHDRNRSESTVAPDAKNILVIRQDSIGDLVLMSAFLRELRQSNPGAKITLVVDPKLVNLVELCPYVNQVLSVNLAFCGITVNLGRVLEALRFSCRNLRARRFDLALIPRWDADLYHSSYLAVFSGAKRRVAYSEDVLPSKSEVNRGFDLLLTQAIQDRAPKHEVERNLDLLRVAGGSIKNSRLELWLSDEDRQTVRRMLELNGVSDRDLIVAMGVGAAHRRRRWPLARFIEIGRFLAAEYGARIVVIGGPEDGEFGTHFKDAVPGAVQFCGSLTLRQTGALLERGQLTIANDSGPMHLAAAAGSAVIEISCHPRRGDASHENSPARFKPWTVDSVVLQPEEPTEPCKDACGQNHAHCILGVKVKEVKAAAEFLLTSRIQGKQTGQSLGQADPIPLSR